MTRRAAVEEWISIRRMPPGRRGWCFHAVGVELAQRGATSLAALAAEGEAAEEHLIALSLRFKGGQAAADPATWPREVVTQDAAVDRKVSGLFDLFRTLGGLFAATPEGPLWQELVLAAFPAGAAYYTNVPYIEEAARIRALLAELRAERWAPLTTTSVVAAAIQELVATFEPYAAAIARFVAEDRVSWEEVKTRDLDNHRRLARLIARLHVDYADDETTRAALLAPIARQDQEVYALQRARRRLTDIDPKSGTPLEPEATGDPTEPPAPPA